MWRMQKCQESGIQFRRIGIHAVFRAMRGAAPHFILRRGGTSHKTQTFALSSVMVQNEFNWQRDRFFFKYRS